MTININDVMANDVSQCESNIVWHGWQYYQYYSIIMMILCNVMAIIANGNNQWQWRIISYQPTNSQYYMYQ